MFHQIKHRTKRKHCKLNIERDTIMTVFPEYMLLGSVCPRSRHGRLYVYVMERGGLFKNMPDDETIRHGLINTWFMAISGSMPLGTHAVGVEVKRTHTWIVYNSYNKYD